MTLAAVPTQELEKLQSAADAGKELSRRFAVKLIFFIYILALAEGPLRKWFVPGLATPIFFIRDPFVIFLYAYCLQKRLVVLTGWAQVWLIFAAFSSAVGAFPFLTQGIDARAWILGIRTYWLYMPLAFVVGSTFRKADLSRFLRLNLLLAIPYSVLVIAQYRSPPGAWINGGIGGDESVVVMAAGTIRPNGLFTYTGQNVNFSASVIAFFISFLMLKSRGKKSWLILILAAPAIASLAVLTGSRSIYFMIAGSLLATMVGTMMRPSASSIKTNMLLIGCVGLATYLFIHVFSDAYEAMQVRLEGTERLEGPIQNRALGGVLSFLWPLATAPVFGHGIGIGIPAISSNFLHGHVLYLGEAELMRNVNELGIVNGLIFVALRFGFAAYLMRISLRAARADRPEFLPLAGFAALGIAQSQITFSTLNGFPYWLVAGLVLASLRTATSPPLRSADNAPVLNA